MNTAELRQRLHRYLDNASEKKIKALFTVIEDSINEHELEYTPELKLELDKRTREYKQGLLTTIPAKESKSRIQKILKPSGK